MQSLFQGKVINIRSNRSEVVCSQNRTFDLKYSTYFHHSWRPLRGMRVCLAFLLIFLMLGPAYPASSKERPAFPDQGKNTSVSGTDQPALESNGSIEANGEDAEYLDYDIEEEGDVVPDPLAPLNRAIYHFNDKLYFWLLKPAAKGYRAIFPEALRISVRNFFSNLLFPVRFTNCLLQTNIEEASIEFSRFSINTTMGIGGLFDPAKRYYHITEQDEDFGQTLGVYGIKEGLYLNLPVFGPSTLRDSVGMAGDYFLKPLSYIDPFEVSLGISSYKTLNDTSLKIGDYEALKEASIDPYLSMRNAYLQYRQKKLIR